MLHRYLLVLPLLALAGCSMQMPGFLGREGDGGASFTVRQEPLAPPMPVPMRSARAERALGGQIVRVEAVAPTQGYFSAQLLVENNGRPDANGVMAYRLVAHRPTTPQAIGPERTRELHAAFFVPNRALRDISAVRITAANTAQTLPLR